MTGGFVKRLYGPVMQRQKQINFLLPHRSSPICSVASEADRFPDRYATAFPRWRNSCAGRRIVLWRNLT
jgi:hypothetical protein